MKKIVLCVTAVLFFGFSSFSLAEIKIGVLDMDRVLTSLQQIRDIQAYLKKKFDPRGKKAGRPTNASLG